MSAYTKRKYVSKEIDEFDDLPTDKSIVKIICGKGNNLHLVKTNNGEEYLASMPTKFRKHVWVKRGNFVLVEPIEEGDKVKAQITHVLLKTHIKQLKKEGKWPKIFDEDEDSKIKDNEENKTVVNDDEDEYSSDDSSIDLEENPNHTNNYNADDESDESSSDNEASSEEEEDKK